MLRRERLPARRAVHRCAGQPCRMDITLDFTKRSEPSGMVQKGRGGVTALAGEERGLPAVQGAGCATDLAQLA